MEEYVVYILFSKKFNKIYIGFTSILITRIHSHNKLSKKGYKIKFRPRELVYVEFFTMKKSALRREKLLKFGQDRKWIREFILL